MSRRKTKVTEIFTDAHEAKGKGQKGHLVFKSDAIPKFLPARTIPIAIEKQVNAETNKIVDDTCCAVK